MGVRKLWGRAAPGIGQFGSEMIGDVGLEEPVDAGEIGKAMRDF